MLVKPYIIYDHVKRPESTTLTQNSHTPSCLFSSPRSLRTHLLCVAFRCHHSCTFHTAEEREENCEGPSPTRFALFDGSIHTCALHFIVSHHLFSYKKTQSVTALSKFNYSSIHFKHLNQYELSNL